MLKRQLKRLVLKVLQKIGILKYLNITFSMVINNHLYNIPLIGGIGLNNLLSLSESWMLRLLKELISQSGRKKIFVDVGANIGQTLLKVKATEQSMVYIAFEPNPICVNYLGKLVAANDLVNVEIFPLGIGSKTSVASLQFYSDSTTDASASLIQNFRMESSIKSKMHVPVFSPSDIPVLNNLENEVGILKIDVEGAELEVLKGFTDLIEKSRPFILVEILPVYSEDNTVRLIRQREIEAMINRLQYRLFRINKNEDEFVSLTEISSIGIHSDLNQCDYIICPIECSSQIIDLAM